MLIYQSHGATNKSITDISITHTHNGKAYSSLVIPKSRNFIHATDKIHSSAAKGAVFTNSLLLLNSFAPDNVIYQLAA